MIFDRLPFIDQSEPANLFFPTHIKGVSGMNDRLPVSQRVREVAAELSTPNQRLFIREGTRDHTFLLQTLAKFEKQCMEPSTETES